MGTTLPVAEDTRPVEEIERILLTAMGKFEDACLQHVPFWRGSQSITYIPERCFVTYFSWALINEGFAVFNEQSVCQKPTGEGKVGSQAETVKKKERFDLVAMRSSLLPHKSIQLKAEAKGNLENGYDAILADIARMERCTFSPGIRRADQMAADDEVEFAHHFNIVITQNWGLEELTEWWRDETQIAPRHRGSQNFRTATGWEKLKNKLSNARRGVVPVSDLGYGYSVDVLYAILGDSPVATS